MAVCTTRDEGRARVIELVAAFKRREADHRSAGYNETQARTDFISPLLGAFGWDVHNDRGHALGLREVFEEATVDVGPERLSKRPDYELRLARQRKLFVEAKKPRLDIERDLAAAFQVRRYGFSGSLPISVLTNFRQLAVYDCGPVPDATDLAHVARILFVNYEEYEARFDELWDLFSREAVYSGAFDLRFDVGVTRLGAQQFDDLFLGQVKRWRAALAVDIHQAYPQLTSPELTYVVQLMLSRIVFLRICEDRDIEVYERLRSVRAPGVYAGLHAMLREADNFYNSGLFHHPEDDPLAVQVSDETMAGILSDLYYPQSPYTFSVVEPEVLGQIYEQFLGEEIVIGQDGVEIVSKPEVRESGGVVPTPRFIVDAIVARALSPQLESRGPKELAGFTVADLCCGSGIFLLSAYEVLLEHYLDWYINNDREAHDGHPIYEVADGVWRLTFAERRRILMEHIRGVDIDANAAEIARLSLLLKLVETETRADLDAFVMEARTPALPALDPVIRSGNSLVSYEEWEAFRPQDDRPATLHPFSWSREFPDTDLTGGFDVIIGNPPYTRIQVMQRYFPDEVAFYQSAASPYASGRRANFDKYALFVERSLQRLKADGRLGLIIPHKFMSTAAGKELRGLLSDRRLVETVVHFGAQQVFSDVATYTCILIANGQGQAQLTLERVSDLERWRYGTAGLQMTVSAESLSEEPWEIAEPGAMAAFERMRALHPARLGTEAEIFVGLQTSADAIYVLRPTSETDNHVVVTALGQDWPVERGILRPCLHDVTLTAFAHSPANRLLIFPYKTDGGRQRLIQPPELQRNFPGCWAYLEAHRGQLARRAVGGGPVQENQWYQFGRSQSLGKFDTEKLIVQVLSREPRYAYDDTNAMFTGGGNGPYYGLRCTDRSSFSLPYLLAVMCHPLSEAMIRTRTSVFRGGYYSHGKQFLSQLPIPDPGDAVRQRIDALSQDLVRAHEDLNRIRIPAARAQRERDIAHLTQTLEGVVTQAFGLAPEEVDVVKAVPVPD